MIASDTCRVCVHRGAAAIDVALPAEIPVAVLIPSIVDMLDGDDGHDHGPARYRLSVPGEPELDPSTTLAQNRVRDGTVLMLTRREAPTPAPRHVDTATAVAAAVEAAAQHGDGRSVARFGGVAAAIAAAGVGGLALIRDSFAEPAGEAAATVAVLASAGLLALGLATVAHRAYRDAAAGLTLGVIATAFAAVAGFVAVPGPPGVANVLLAAAAVGVTAATSMRVSGCGTTTLTAMSCCAVVIAAAALAGVIGPAPPQSVASAAGLASLALLGAAARASIAVVGLSPDAADAEPDVVPRKAIRAGAVLTGLLAGLSASASLGAVVTVLVAPARPACLALGALTGALLLLRSRCTDRKRMVVFVFSGSIVTATTFGVAAAHWPMPRVAAATATLVAAAMYLGFVAPGKTVSPLVRRGAELLEWLALAAMVPLTCWICGIYGAARGLHLA